MINRIWTTKNISKYITYFTWSEIKTSAKKKQIQIQFKSNAAQQEEKLVSAAGWSLA